jgi:hypothetical protein
MTSLLVNEKNFRWIQPTNKYDIYLCGYVKYNDKFWYAKLHSPWGNWLPEDEDDPDPVDYEIIYELISLTFWESVCFRLKYYRGLTRFK